jgi:integrase
VGDIDFLRRTRTVSRQIQRQVGGFEVRAPKYGSERTVFLAPALASVFTEHVANYRPENDLTRWLFTGAGEEPPHQNTVTHRWMKTRQAAGLESLELNDCRHFYASGLIAHGADVVTVQRALGRAKATTTFNTYLAHRRGSHRQAAEAMLVETLNLAGSVRTTGTD